MTDVLVDSNVILDVLTESREWEQWSAERLRDVASGTRLVINPIIYAEVSVRFSALEELEEVLSSRRFCREDLPWPAAFLAGKAYLAYCRRGGTRRSPLSDFYIGAHAATAGYRLLTRDAGRYRTSFPRLQLITPDGPRP